MWDGGRVDRDLHLVLQGSLKAGDDPGVVYDLFIDVVDEDLGVAPSVLKEHNLSMPGEQVRMGGKVRRRGRGVKDLVQVRM